MRKKKKKSEVVKGTGKGLANESVLLCGQKRRIAGAWGKKESEKLVPESTFGGKRKTTKNCTTPRLCGRFARSTGGGKKVVPRTLLERKKLSDHHSISRKRKRERKRDCWQLRGIGEGEREQIAQKGVSEKGLRLESLYNSAGNLSGEKSTFWSVPPRSRLKEGLPRPADLKVVKRTL